MKWKSTIYTFADETIIKLLFIVGGRENKNGLELKLPRVDRWKYLNVLLNLIYTKMVDYNINIQYP